MRDRYGDVYSNCSEHELDVKVVIEQDSSV